MRVIAGGGRRSSPSSSLLPHYSSTYRKPARAKFYRIPSKRWLLLLLAFLAVAPPLFFHFRFRRFHQMRLRKCGWLQSPPLVCAHGGDSSRAVPNTMDAYRIAIDSRVDCIEMDISRSSDGVLFSLHDSRDLQRMSGNSTARVGYMNMNEIKELDAGSQFPQEFHNQKVPTAESALALITSSVGKVILDAKVGPPSYEKDLAKDILSIVNKTHCQNCLVWSKSDILGRDVTELSQDVMQDLPRIKSVRVPNCHPVLGLSLVGYIVMSDPSTGARSKLLRMKGAGVVGVYHHLVDTKLVRILHRAGKKVYAWTVDDSESMQRMLFEGVDAIITSNPGLLQGLMQDLKTECLQDDFP
ncbi:glycerophosphodiester phosphodiesterase GDPD4-like isoform X2 [Zingiber officinale]|uniref:glycerophosphodiester phosphodiesterase GDPD4-like isoform X2 n=1 Tax=Zingiber officinale TaxID=94328 RepID=UPI001C4D9B29|nr:glycerophosphodiester phosphodiesterase GDPD4-like isoform X2 [Zingiber officinale]